jgi:hypothetical protein
MRKYVALIACLAVSAPALAETPPFWERQQMFECTMDNETGKTNAPLRLRIDLAQASLCVADGASCKNTRKLSIARSPEKLSLAYRSEGAQFSGVVLPDGTFSMTILEGERRIEDTGRCTRAGA